MSNDTEIQIVTPDPVSAAGPSLAAIRVRVLDRMFWTMVWVGGLVVAITTAQDYAAGNYVNAMFYSFAYAVVLAGLAIKAIAYLWRSLFSLLTIFLVGMFELWNFGMDGVGTLFLFAFTVFSCVLLGSRAGAVAVFLSVCSLVCLGHLDLVGHESLGQAWNLWPPVAENWTPTILSFALLSVMAVLFISLLLRSLENSVQRAHTFLIALTEERNQLTDEVANRKRAQKESKLRQQQLIQADKMASMGVLVSGVAHEINNPNSFISLNAPILTDLWTHILPILDDHAARHPDFQLGSIPYTMARDRIPQLLDAIGEGAGRIGGIVSSLKDFARTDTGAMDEWVDLDEVIATAVMLLRNRLNKSTKKFRVDAPQDLPRIRGNRQRLEQVVINLINNACDALPSTDCAVRVKTEVSPDQDFVHLIVNDEGVGIAAESLARVCDPFYTTKRGIGGTGLGLSISDAIIRDHGGTMTFKSTVGLGTSVTISFPIKGTEVHSNSKDYASTPRAEDAGATRSGPKNGSTNVPFS